MYYAASGLLVKHGIEAKSHAGVKTQFFLHFVKTGTIGLDKGKLYADLFDWRQKGDYNDFFDFKKEDVVNLAPQSKELLNAIITVIKEKQSDDL